MTELIAELTAAAAGIASIAAIAWLVKRFAGPPLHISIGDRETVVSDSEDAHLLSQSNVVTVSGTGRRLKVVAVGATGELGSSLGLPLPPDAREFNLIALSSQDPKLASQLWQGFLHYLRLRATQVRSPSGGVSAWRAALSKGVVSISVTDSATRSVIHAALSTDRTLSLSQGQERAA